MKPGTLLGFFVLIRVLLPQSNAAVPFFVDLDENPNLTGIFKSGLRPAVVRGLETVLCEIRPQTAIAFKGSGITTPPLEANWEFTLSAKRRLVGIRGYSQQAWTAAEAYEEIAPLEQVLGGDLSRMKAFLDGYPATSTNGDMWANRHRVKDGIRIGYYFRHSMQEMRPFLATYYIDWDLPAREVYSGDTPIAPPPGYEDADMRPFEVQEYEKWQNTQVVVPAPPGSPTTPSEPSPGSSAAGPRFMAWWWLWLPLIALLALGVHRLESAWIKRRKQLPGQNSGRGPA